jgi:geranylgeranyl diphosphate synthase type II
MSLASSLQTILDPYRIRIDNDLHVYITNNMPENPLRKACSYALGHGAKRLRPALVIMVAEALNTEYNATLPALAVEFFHTASLIVDDLPCMDNDDVRRNAPTVHRAFGEATALLASYALIAEGYACFTQATHQLAASAFPYANNSATIGLLAIENASQNNGVSGAAGGQYLDLFIQQPDDMQIEEIVIKKTVSLFETALVTGWLYGGGSLTQLETVKAVAYQLGMAFQIIDDFADYSHDHQQNAANMVAACGISSAYEKLENALIAFESTLKELKLADSPLTHIAHIMRINARLTIQSSF